MAGVLIVGDVVTVRAALYGGAGTSESTADGTDRQGAEAREASVWPQLTKPRRSGAEA